MDSNMTTTWNELSPFETRSRYSLFYCKAGSTAQELPARSGDTSEQSGKSRGNVAKNVLYIPKNTEENAKEDHEHENGVHDAVGFLISKESPMGLQPWHSCIRLCEDTRRSCKERCCARAYFSVRASRRSRGSSSPSFESVLPSFFLPIAKAGARLQTLGAPHSTAVKRRSAFVAACCM